MDQLQEPGWPKSKWRSFTWNDQILDDAIHGRVRILSMGQIWRYRLTERQRERFEDSKKRGYVVCRKTSEDQALLSVWFTWCEIHQWPYVKVVEARKYAAVEIDLIAMSYKMNTETKRSLQKQVESILGPGRWRRCRANQCIAYVLEVPLADTPAVAQLMLESGLTAKEEAAKNPERTDLSGQHPTS